MILTTVILISLLVVVAFSGISFLLIAPFLPHLSAHQRRPLIAIVAVASMLIALNLVTAYLNGFVLFYQLPPRHACGGPYVPLAAPCEAALAQEALRQNALADDHYLTWNITPPPLRPSCDWVAPVFCEMLKENPSIGSWERYIALIGIIILSGLAPAVTVNWLFRRAAQQPDVETTWQGRDDPHLPEFDS